MDAEIHINSGIIQYAITISNIVNTAKYPKEEKYSFIPISVSIESYIFLIASIIPHNKREDITNFYNKSNNTVVFRAYKIST